MDKNIKIETIQYMEPSHYGLRFYPITYKDKKYVVELCKTDKTICRIYEYKEKLSIFNRHKGTFLWGNTIEFIFIDGNKLLNIHNELDNKNYDEIIINLPDVLKYIFVRWENEIEVKKERETQIQKIKKWDGVII